MGSSLQCIKVSEKRVDFTFSHAINLWLHINWNYKVHHCERILLGNKILFVFISRNIKNILQQQSHASRELYSLNYGRTLDLEDVAILIKSCLVHLFLYMRLISGVSLAK